MILLTADALNVYLILAIIVDFHYDIRAYIKRMASDMSITGVMLVCNRFICEKIVIHMLTFIHPLDVLDQIVFCYLQPQQAFCNAAPRNGEML